MEVVYDHGGYGSNEAVLCYWAGMYGQVTY